MDSANTCTFSNEPENAEICTRKKYGITAEMEASSKLQIEASSTCHEPCSASSRMDSVNTSMFPNEIAEVSTRKKSVEQTSQTAEMEACSILETNPPSSTQPKSPTIPSSDFKLILPSDIHSPLEPTCPPPEDDIKLSAQEKAKKFYLKDNDVDDALKKGKLKNMCDIKHYEQKGVSEHAIALIMKLIFQSNCYAFVLVFSNLMYLLKPGEPIIPISKLEDLDDDGVYLMIEYFDSGTAHAKGYFKQEIFDPSDYQMANTCVIHCIHYLKLRQDGLSIEKIRNKYPSKTKSDDNDRMVLNYFKQSLESENV